MLTMTATEFLRNFRAVLDRLEHSSEEIVIMRHNHAVAKLIPGAPAVPAINVFSDLYGIIDDREGQAWLDDCTGADHCLKDEVQDPWE